MHFTKIGCLSLYRWHVPLATNANTELHSVLAAASHGHGGSLLNRHVAAGGNGALLHC